MVVAFVLSFSLKITLTSTVLLLIKPIKIYIVVIASANVLAKKIIMERFRDLSNLTLRPC